MARQRSYIWRRREPHVEPQIGGHGTLACDGKRKQADRDGTGHEGQGRAPCSDKIFGGPLTRRPDVDSSFELQNPVFGRTADLR